MTMHDPSPTPAGQIPLPVPSPMSEPFWAGTRQHKLMLQKCLDCGAWRWTPQVLCRNCQSERCQWTETSGRGALYSYTIVHRPPLPAFKSPYVLAVVELAEGPLMLTNLVDCEEQSLKVGMPLEVAFERASEAITLYKFRRAQ